MYACSHYLPWNYLLWHYLLWHYLIWHYLIWHYLLSLYLLWHRLLWHHLPGHCLLWHHLLLPQVAYSGSLPLERIACDADYGAGTKLLCALPRVRELSQSALYAATTPYVVLVDDDWMYRPWTLRRVEQAALLTIALLAMASLTMALLAMTLLTTIYHSNDRLILPQPISNASIVMRLLGVVSLDDCTDVVMTQVSFRKSQVAPVSAVAE